MRFLNIIKGDRTIWLIVVILSIFSTLVVYSSSIALAYRYKDGHSEYFLFKHVSITLVGLFFIYVIHKIKIDAKHFNVIGVVGFLLSIPLLLYTFISGVKSGEASRWVEVPGLGITFQSSDIAKIMLIFFIARNLAFNRKKFTDIKSVVLKILFPTLIICGLILLSNFSTAFLLAVTVLYLILLSDIEIKILLKIFGILLIVGIVFIAVVYFFPDIFPRGRTWKSRIENFSKQDSKTNYQIEQAKIAIANGPIIGRGPGNSAQRAFLPQANSDFIYAILIEEYGSIAGIMVALAFLIIFFRSIRIAQKSDNLFYTYLVSGLSFNLVLQAIVNMAVAVNLIPVTGQPLPFISMGGTSIVFSSINIGIILNISRQIYEKRISKKTISETIPEDKLSLATS